MKQIKKAWNKPRVFVMSVKSTNAGKAGPGEDYSDIGLSAS